MAETYNGDFLRTRIAAVLRLHQWRATVRTSDDDPVLDCTCGMAFGPHREAHGNTFDCYRDHVADAVIRELGAIPDREFTDQWGHHWEWCGGQPGTWAWRITQNGPVDVDVECAICHRTYSVRSDAPGWSSVWTCCLSCQANEENEWISR